VPVVGLHPPPALGELERIDVDAAVHQLLRLTTRLSGSRADARPDRLAEVVGHTMRAASLWSDILEMGRLTPAPFTFFDTLVHVAPMILLRGTAEAVDYYELLKSEIADRIADGVAAVPAESHRFYWDGPPIWCGMRPLARLFADHGVAIVGSTFCSVFALTGLDRDNPIESMARAYTGVFGNRSEGYKTAYLAEKFGTRWMPPYHDCRTTPEASHVRYGLAVRAAPTGVSSSSSKPTHTIAGSSAERLQMLLTEFSSRSSRTMRQDHEYQGRFGCLMIPG
jgi:hypothetical protein